MRFRLPRRRRKTRTVSVTITADTDRLRLALADAELSITHMLARAYKHERDEAHGKILEIRNALAAWENELINRRECIDSIDRILA